MFLCSIVNQCYCCSCYSYFIVVVPLLKCSLSLTPASSSPKLYFSQYIIWQIWFSLKTCLDIIDVAVVVIIVVAAWIDVAAILLHNWKGKNLYLLLITDMWCLTCLKIWRGEEVVKLNSLYNSMYPIELFCFFFFGLPQSIHGCWEI